MIGSFYDSSTYGEVGVCIAGTVNGSTISGEAVEWIQDLNVQLPEVYAKDQVAAWDQNGYLKLARGAVLSQNQLSGHQDFHYKSALLNMNGFHRYNVGTTPPPTTCR